MKERKFVVALAISLFLGAFFVANQPITPRLALVSSLSVLLFAAPSYLAVIATKGRKKGLWLLLMLGIYALVIESLAIKTGFPYGKFTYENVLGNKIFGLTPWTVAFAYPPILLGSFFVADRFVSSSVTHSPYKKYGSLALLTAFVRSTHQKRPRLTLAMLTAIMATAADVVLDSAAVRLGFWHWDKPGFFYGVPLINFLGWLLTGFIGAVILHHLWGQKHQTTPGVAYSGLAILWFWTGVNVFLAQWIPAIIGVLSSLLLVRVIKNKEATIGR